jgi:multidrug efflux pump subunit AcrB
VRVEHQVARDAPLGPAVAAVKALLVTGESMSLIVLIGLMMLMGIVTKNSILGVVTERQPAE